MTLLDAMDDPHLFKPFFKDRDTWAAWRACIAAAFGLPMTPEQLMIYRQCTGRTDPPIDVAKEIYLVIGRRGGKSRILALTAVWLAVFIDHSDSLAPGEIGVVQLLASDRRQAKILVRYIHAFLANVPMLSHLIENETQEGITLTNRIAIEVTTASFRSVRGRTVVAALLDELAFWWSEDSSANPDTEVVAAVRPSMATVSNAMLIAGSSPYARKGVLYSEYKKHFGKDGTTLVWQADTKTMNPAVDQKVIDDAYEADPSAASAEYGAQFRADIEAFVSREAVEAVVSPGVYERPYISGLRYSAFLDPAGGSGKDSFTAAIAHMEGDIAILDVIREFKPPFSPEAVVSELATLLKSYGISKVLGDRFAGEWVRQPFKLKEISYDPAAKPKSDLYRDCLPLINSGKVDLLDHARLQSQLLGLERRTARSGKDSIDHAASAHSHDDLINAAAGAICSLSVRKYKYDSSLRWVTGDLDDASVARMNQQWRASQLNQFIFSGGRFR